MMEVRADDSIGAATYFVEVIGEPNRDSNVKVKNGENEKVGTVKA